MESVCFPQLDEFSGCLASIWSSDSSEALQHSYTPRDTPESGVVCHGKAVCHAAQQVRTLVPGVEGQGG